MSEPSALLGVTYGAIARHADSRGAFRELWRASLENPTDRYVQANLSSSVAGVLRGLHLHRRQRDRWIVASGRALVALVDVRPMLVADATSAPDATFVPGETSAPDADSAAGPIIETRELGADDWVEIPRGVAHGFLALEPLELVYFVSNEFDGTDELGFAWDDPTAAVPWPAVTATADDRPILSERDRSNPSLTDLVARLRAES